MATCWMSSAFIHHRARLYRSYLHPRRQVSPLSHGRHERVHRMRVTNVVVSRASSPGSKWTARRMTPCGWPAGPWRCHPYAILRLVPGKTHTHRPSLCRCKYKGYAWVPNFMLVSQCHMIRNFFVSRVYF